MLHVQAAIVHLRAHVVVVQAPVAVQVGSQASRVTVVQLRPVAAMSLLVHKASALGVIVLHVLPAIVQRQPHVPGPTVQQQATVHVRHGQKVSAASSAAMHQQRHVASIRAARQRNDLSRSPSQV